MTIPEGKDELIERLRVAKVAFDAMSPAEYAAMIAAQRESWVRGMTAKCEHGWLDFEQCPDCRAQAALRTNGEQS